MSATSQTINCDRGRERVKGTHLTLPAAGLPREGELARDDRQPTRPQLARVNDVPADLGRQLNQGDRHVEEAGRRRRGPTPAEFGAEVERCARTLLRQRAKTLSRPRADVHVL